MRYDPDGKEFLNFQSCAITVGAFQLYSDTSTLLSAMDSSLVNINHLEELVDQEILECSKSDTEKLNTLLDLKHSLVKQRGQIMNGKFGNINLVLSGAMVATAGAVCGTLSFVPGV